MLSDSNESLPVIFVQNKQVLPSLNISSEKVPPIQYTISGILDTMPIMDSESITHTEIDPYQLSTRDVVLEIVLEKVYQKDTFTAIFDYTTPAEVIFEVSTDGRSYFSVTRDSIADFDVRYIRMVFRKVVIQSNPSWIRGISFYPDIDLGYLVMASWTGEITAYRNSVCDTTMPVVPYFPATYESPKMSSTLRFARNPLYKNDSDTDGISGTSDNCPTVPNPDQADRNYDGRGDACSDDDADNISGAQDNCPTVPNSDQKDLNVNQLWDACEFDSDGDGIVDAIDNAIHVKNPDQKDTDKDAIGDIMDNCGLYNPDQIDFDKNGKWDVCDRDIEYRKVNDTDKDGILDLGDSCMKAPNPDQRDTDRDGVGDVCDNCISIQNTDQGDDDKNGKGNMCDDEDSDSIEWWRDNCPIVSNTDQKDDNNNNVGNACEDTDADGILDGADNCPALYNNDQKDTDGDKVGNSCDTKDDRMLESNKTVFIVLFATIALLFIGGIIFFLRRFKF